MRGEYADDALVPASVSELPPRARRIRGCWVWLSVRMGTTSACAENTPLLVCARYPPGNYLRVRGEYVSNHASVMLNTELPPRARRIRKFEQSAEKSHGTTSACAENTHSQTPCRNRHCELPPRARRIRKNLTAEQINDGTTSACAENTVLSAAMLGSDRNYLRVRGEYMRTT